LSRLFTCAEVHDGFAERSNAAAAAETCGVAIEVPAIPQ
jgi:hypothetical protein